MYIDKLLQFSVAQAVTSSAASTSSIDNGCGGTQSFQLSVDAYSELWLVVRSVAAATAAGSATVDFQLQTATDSAFTSPVVLFDSSAIAKAALTANTTQVKVKIPPGMLQYLRVYYTVATGPLTAGTFDAFLVKDVKIGNS